MTELSDRLKTVVLRAAANGPAEWFGRCWPQPGIPVRRAVFRAAYAGCGRRLGDDPPALDAGRRGWFIEAGMVMPERWTLSEFGRAALLLRALSIQDPDEHFALMAELFRKGDYREQAAVLKTLALAPDAVRFVDLAVEACRTNVLDVFEAICCENSYPAAYFPEPNFNQLCMKALFMEVPLDRLHGLDDRHTPELSRMAADYASERRAAGRSVPDDIALLVE